MKERARNQLKDFFTMAPALGVTHLLAFTLTDIAPSLRIVRLSAGPTLSFRIERYSLVKDVLNSSKRARSIGSVEYLTPPLVSVPWHFIVYPSDTSNFRNSSCLHPSPNRDQAVLPTSLFS